MELKPLLRKSKCECLKQYAGQIVIRYLKGYVIRSIEVAKAVRSS